MWCIYIHTYIDTYSGILLSYKKNEIMPVITTWVNLRGIKLSEISQTGKDKCYGVSFICGI